jgi:hypothetical protein
VSLLNRFCSCTATCSCSLGFGSFQAARAGSGRDLHSQAAYQCADLPVALLHVAYVWAGSCCLIIVRSSATASFVSLFHPLLKVIVNNRTSKEQRPLVDRCIAVFKNKLCSSKEYATSHALIHSCCLAYCSRVHRQTSQSRGRVHPRRDHQDDEARSPCIRSSAARIGVACCPLLRSLLPCQWICCEAGAGSRQVSGQGQSCEIEGERA